MEQQIKLGDTAGTGNRYSSSSARRARPHQRQKWIARMLWFVAACPWILFFAFWLFLTRVRSLVMKLKVAMWFLQAPYNLATETQAKPVYVILSFAVLSLFGVAALKKSKFWFLAAIFLLGLIMLVSACVQWSLFMQDMGT